MLQGLFARLGVGVGALNEEQCDVLEAKCPREEATPGAPLKGGLDASLLQARPFLLLFKMNSKSASKARADVVSAPFSGLSSGLFSLSFLRSCSATPGSPFLSGSQPLVLPPLLDLPLLASKPLLPGSHGDCRTQSTLPCRQGQSLTEQWPLPWGCLMPIKR